MSAVFGYELDLTKLSPEEKKQVKDQIISYQTIRPVIQYGHYYRLASPLKKILPHGCLCLLNKMKLLCF